MQITTMLLGALLTSVLQYIIGADPVWYIASKDNLGRKRNWVSPYDKAWDQYVSNNAPWLRMPDTMCMREACDSDGDCCKRYNICDKSAKICRDCWYRQYCRSPLNCCEVYPICDKSSSDDMVGYCVNKKPQESQGIFSLS